MKYYPFLNGSSPRCVRQNLLEVRTVFDEAGSLSVALTCLLLLIRCRFSYALTRTSISKTYKNECRLFRSLQLLEDKCNQTTEGCDL